MATKTKHLELNIIEGSDVPSYAVFNENTNIIDEKVNELEMAKENQALILNANVDKTTENTNKINEHTATLQEHTSNIRNNSLNTANNTTLLNSHTTLINKQTDNITNLKTRATALEQSNANVLNILSQSKRFIGVNDIDLNLPTNEPLSIFIDNDFVVDVDNNLFENTENGIKIKESGAYLIFVSYSIEPTTTSSNIYMTYDNLMCTRTKNYDTPTIVNLLNNTQLNSTSGKNRVSYFMTEFLYEDDLIYSSFKAGSSNRQMSNYNIMIIKL